MFVKQFDSVKRGSKNMVSDWCGGECLSNSLILLSEVQRTWSQTGVEVNVCQTVQFFKRGSENMVSDWCGGECLSNSLILLSVVQRTWPQTGVKVNVHQTV